ncbi:nuclease-related domain-containing protein [Nostoc sp. CMAA1605]|uniref:nuclease-related domain-containing protein n=1 Tax=Nostoc sp. CMAA1605 TaxID=2055159 RepID=UPI001F45E5F0|nr:nuclease-related domain-containing protein [Nostoc sp. CMAA1605]MCF4970244.1 nuclease [Nostoc sp. CMAA1605]
MPKVYRNAGQNVRELALKRRLKAISLFVSAALITIFPNFLVSIFNNFLKQLPSLNSAATPKIQLPSLLYILFVFVALGLVFNGVNLWKMANRADQGAAGEENIAKSLNILMKTGWRIEYGTLLGNGLGDADIICTSPRNNTYVIDVKSHRGEIITDGGYISRKMGKVNHQFEKDFIEMVMKQALQVKKQKQLNFVTPIVAFSQAKVSLPLEKIRGVYVVDKLNLVTLLKSLG